MAKDMCWLKDMFICHRGLHTRDQSVPENSLAAIHQAVLKNHAIEIDVQMTKDQKIIVFHDDDFLRVCGVNQKVAQSTFDLMKHMTLFDTQEKIPTLEEAVSKIDGRVPLLIEIKPDERYQEISKAVYDIIKDYHGNIAIFSFHPGIVYWFKQHAPDIIRGQISSFFKDVDLPWINKMLMKRMCFNVFTRPDFISYHHQDLPNRYADRFKRKGRIVISYKADNKAEFNRVRNIYDNIVYEHFDPNENNT